MLRHEEAEGNYCCFNNCFNYFYIRQKQSDIIVLLTGGGPDRMLGAVDLYKQGYADEIVMVSNLVRGYDLVVSQGVDISHDTDVAREVAVQFGVPIEKVTVLPGDALSTQDEAINVREYLKLMNFYCRGQFELQNSLVFRHL